MKGLGVGGLQQRERGGHCRPDFQQGERRANQRSAVKNAVSAVLAGNRAELLVVKYSKCRKCRHGRRPGNLRRRRRPLLVVAAAIVIAVTRVGACRRDDARALQGTQERGQVLFFARREVDVEARIVEIDNLFQSGTHG